VSRPFIITVASEKGGVGKTTIATNLAVYLKALREDLTVTIASFDNHLSVDQMFVLGPRPDKTVAMLFDGMPPAELATLGQYGVQYMASSRRLTPPCHPPSWLGRMLHSTDMDGLLILDTRPILDWFTEAALQAADLTLVPVKDRASLVNTEALRQVVAEAGRADRLWLVPSLVDNRARLSAEVRVHEFLAFSARERGYQVLDLCISKSPKVESLSSGFSSCIRPVLTHARNTAVHSQFKQLSEFVLTRFDSSVDALERCPAGSMPPGPVENSVVQRRLVLECPVCGRQSSPESGHYFFDLRSRRRGFVHPACFSRLIEDLDVAVDDREVDLIVMTIDGPGLIGPECRLSVHLCAVEQGVVSSEDIELAQKKSLGESLAFMTGRPLDAAYRELILVKRRPSSAADQLSPDACREFASRRRQVARDLRVAGLF
jgi:chromosome partitioning protein